MILMRRNRIGYRKYREAARSLARARLDYFNRFYGFRLGRLFIKNHKSRWGSCSEYGNLNFNYKIVHLPSPIADYIIVHELCHLGQLNHSPAFWALVERTIPDHRARRAALQRLERAQ